MELAPGFLALQRGNPAQRPEFWGKWTTLCGNPPDFELERLDSGGELYH
jgi:hypothetical protein